MKPKNAHLHYDPNRDAVLLVDHTERTPGTPVVAYDYTEEFLFAAASWALRGHPRPRKLNFVEKILKMCGVRVSQATGRRIVQGRSGTLRFTVEHLT